MTPWPVVLAAAIQLATAASFVLMALLAYRYGASAQRAAEAEVIRQGHTPDVLNRGQVNFEERAIELTLPLGIAALLIVLSVLNLTGSELGRIATLVCQSLLLVVGGVVTSQQVFAVRFVQSAFQKSGDEMLSRVDVPALIDAATAAFPSWFRALVAVRFALVTVGSALVLIVVGLAWPSSS